MDNDWKEIWQQSNVEKLPQIDIDLTKKPLSIVQRIERTIKVEYWINWIAAIVGPVWLVFENQLWFGGVIAVLMVPVLLYYHFLIKRLESVKTDANVLSYLKKSHDIIKKFMNHYKLFSWVFGGIGFFLGLSLSPNGLDLQFELSEVLIMLIAISIAIGVVYLIIYWLYGKKFNQLKELIKNIEEE